VVPLHGSRGARGFVNMLSVAFFLPPPLLSIRFLVLYSLVLLAWRDGRHKWDHLLDGVQKALKCGREAQQKGLVVSY
jgi:hypothetical protein